MIIAIRYLYSYDLEPSSIKIYISKRVGVERWVKYMSHSISVSRPRYQGFRISILRVSLTASLTAIAIVLHIFKIPFPIAPFLKFDATGIPLAVIALYSVGDAAVASLVVLPSIIALGADIIGASMKVLAEFSTFVPLAPTYSVLRNRLSRRGLYIVAIMVSLASRVGVMSLANYIVTPYWLVMTYSWPYDKAYRVTLMYLPAIASFNAIVALYVVPIALSIYMIIERLGIKL
ncbi:hypothetical protein Igag_0978 [Ignisphaera aggregans DSM 17230]|uniref:ECF transporter S component n=1 Tax=Ignisphaera aggregans (strain DSM 17230 / JCM 13409 / AQ1.S1) TaxID=583356 RepID=E0SNJ7_IGNAA|nr:hypothetical protein Igag_0978 [Ignisphaera aggregans DSM 17230]